MHAGSTCKYGVGQIVSHRLFGYRGVVVDVDPEFQGTEQWYEAMAKTRPPRDLPWYHVLVHGASHQTYVAERNLNPDTSGDPVVHPAVEHYFSGMADGSYVSRRPVS